MGMFDDLRCHYPLPIQGANDLIYQTKDLDCMMDNYEIRTDGTLWHEEYDIEDRSDPTAEGFMRWSGMMTRVNQRWERVTMTGEVVFYGGFRGDWTDCIEWSAYFLNGELQQINLIKHESPPAADAVDPQVTDTGTPSTRV